jgi:4-hydroxybutyryl-CoA dehydratase/vinylacetyl-CoA-Delta-isomerase
MEDNCVTMAGAITDAKGNRSLRPSQQTEKYSNLHVKGMRSDGIVIRGFKSQICGVAAAHETTRLKPGALWASPLNSRS